MGYMEGCGGMRVLAWKNHYGTKNRWGVVYGVYGTNFGNGVGGEMGISVWMRGSGHP